MSEVTKKVKILITCTLKTVHHSVYKCTVILHVPMARAHRESSMSNLDWDAKRVANIYGITDVLLGWLLQRKKDYSKVGKNITILARHLSGQRNI